MKRISLAFMLFAVATAIGQAAIVVNPSNPVVGQNIQFTQNTPAACGSSKWTFGDGATANAPSPNYQTSHFYKDPGTYYVTFTFLSCSVTPPPVGPTYVTVGDDRTITISPANPVPGQPVTITLNYAKQPPIHWDLGDGTTVTSTGNQVTHVYTGKGTYNIQAYDFNGTSTVPVTFSLNLQDNRELLVSKTDPGVGESITFQARNFFSSQILWNFGDGVSFTGGSVVQHIYRKPGTFTVRVQDPAGQTPGQQIPTATAIGRTFEVIINVRPAPSKIADLMITGMELFFARNRSNYMTVPSGAENVKVVSRMKYEGTGWLNAYWSINGAPYRIISRLLSFGQSVELSLDQVPTLQEGVNEVSIIFNDPKPDFDRIPSIHYFVSGIPNRLTLKIPLDQSEFCAGEIPYFSWENYPLAQRYRFIYASSVPDLTDLESTDGHKTPKTTWEIDQPLEVGEKYFWMVQALDFDQNPIAGSEIRSFTVVKNRFDLKVEKQENLAEIGQQRFVLLEFRAVGGEIIADRRYLIEVYARDLKINSFALKGEDLDRFTTSVACPKDSATMVRVRVFAILPDRLELVSFFQEDLR